MAVDGAETRSGRIVARFLDRTRICLAAIPVARGDASGCVDGTSRSTSKDASTGGSIPRIQQSKASAALGECGSGESVLTSIVTKSTFRSSHSTSRSTSTFVTMPVSSCPPTSWSSSTGAGWYVPTPSLAPGIPVGRCTLAGGARSPSNEECLERSAPEAILDARDGAGANQAAPRSTVHDANLRSDGERGWRTTDLVSGSLDVSLAVVCSRLRRIASDRICNPVIRCGLLAGSLSCPSVGLSAGSYLNFRWACPFLTRSRLAAKSASGMGTYRSCLVLYQCPW